MFRIVPERRVGEVGDHVKDPRMAAARMFASRSNVSAGVLLPWQTRPQKARTVVFSSLTTAQCFPIAGVMWMREEY